MAPVDGSGLIAYRLELIGRDGLLQNREIAAPNHFATDRAGQRIYAPSGWLQVHSDKKPELNCSKVFCADLEHAFDLVMTALAAERWPAGEPFFNRLELRVEGSFYDTPLPLAHECMSTVEAMHEDLHFSALELFQEIRGLSYTDRTLRPGQLVPTIVFNDGPMRVSITAERDPDIDADKSVSASPLIDLADAGHWLEPGQIKAHLQDIGGEPFDVRSRRGRPVWSTHIDRPGPNMVITSGQHANETSGPVGALRAAKHLTESGRNGFTVSPLVNPDSYALFRELSGQYPHHMNHAARFTATGCDLLYVERGFENEAHHIAKEKTGARLHLNLHGYPAHEWTRPFSGYISRGAELWSIPREFMLIRRFAPGWKVQGESILDAIIDELKGFDPIVDFNNEQRERSRLYSGSFPFNHRGGIPYIIEEVDDDLFPITIITEAPDETVYDDAFRLFHTVQMKTVLAAADASATMLS
ncbi:MAG: peptidase M14 [Hyphomicrobiales bacterium]|nr:peptidase M14 [Hyphomicrobiales bacterium]